MPAFSATAHTDMKEPLIGVTLDGHKSLLNPDQAMQLRDIIGRACAVLYRERRDVRERDGSQQCCGCGRTIAHEPYVRDDFDNEFHKDCEELYR